MSLTRRDVLSAGLLLSSALGCRKLETTLGIPIFSPEPPEGPFAAPATRRIDPVRHILNRLSFGPRPEDEGRIRSLRPDLESAIQAYIEEQLEPEAIDDSRAERAVRRLETLRLPAGELFEYKPHVLLDELTRGTLLRAIYSRRQLYEVMVQFWTDHFNIDASKGDCKWLKVADDREVIRRHTLGRFADLLRASALSPAMLWYLDGRVNRRRNDDEISPSQTPGTNSPGTRARGPGANENYARELLELHTLGVDGGYTQHDVMETARCLTGWTVRSDQLFGKGRVEFASHRHDDGEKLVLGRRIPAGQGEKDLDHVLEAVVSHPRTAHYLANKLCRKFVSEAPGDEAIRAVADVFTRSGGEIKPTLRAVFETPAFRDSAGLKLKRPFRFIVSTLRATGATTDGGRRLQNYLLSMGHAPFQYPTPDGYPEEATPWLGTLLWRWNFAAALADDRIAGTRVDLPKLRSAFGDDGLRAHLLGRLPSGVETGEDGPATTELALLLASPAFQRY